MESTTQPPNYIQASGDFEFLKETDRRFFAVDADAPAEAYRGPPMLKPRMPRSEIEALIAGERQSISDRLAAGASPFRVHAAKVLGFNSTAVRMQALVLSLYHSHEWHKREPVRLDDLLASADQAHCEAALDMLRWYWRHGENDADFMALGKQLAMDRQPKRRKS